MMAEPRRSSPAWMLAMSAFLRLAQLRQEAFPDAPEIAVRHDQHDVMTGSPRDVVLDDGVDAGQVARVDAPLDERGDYPFRPHPLVLRDPLGVVDLAPDDPVGPGEGLDVVVLEEA